MIYTTLCREEVILSSNKTGQPEKIENRKAKKRIEDVNPIIERAEVGK